MKHRQPTVGHSSEANGISLPQKQSLAKTFESGLVDPFPLWSCTGLILETIASLSSQLLHPCHVQKIMIPEQCSLVFGSYRLSASFFLTHYIPQTLCQADIEFPFRIENYWITYSLYFDYSWVFLLSPNHCITKL